ncbi:bifunctional 3-phenylpropionate/cinnamic acid dioxygenase ferredoxin subunit [Pseudonocardia asaccharolytica]|uniref:3-phenylpropionate/cinnamic acid dioxygenase ferredoxin subunit n=1 Tax=Pseudonocardia asaccharolytica DSM 44247 = NBRC 16224 TaxID=1123024 RepID=A0A511D014_9PSEU|nr:bifunctional 3-phenylpropionate/cinnamic acid dioxygenase ferredoxin subunit [Pseudonocardia asaccharolytica]GEL18140.1 3-phenylpropionate/cinnamic acid dioxygenase ferredoxin subunit [Pseudonocardia asaccharolytica DSM 44247 = NBRC 16224]
MAWVRACGASEIKPGEAARIDADPPVAVFNVDGEFLATSDTCTHEESSLADGYVDGAQVECAWHFAKFCLRTGRALSLPATEDLTTYRVRVADDAVFVDI